MVAHLIPVYVCACMNVQHDSDGINNDVHTRAAALKSAMMDMVRVYFIYSIYVIHVCLHQSIILKYLNHL